MHTLAFVELGVALAEHMTPDVTEALQVSEFLGHSIGVDCGPWTRHLVDKLQTVRSPALSAVAQHFP